ncbi:MAG: hypothetical protein RSE33_19250 [Hafnia sp.]
MDFIIVFSFEHWILTSFIFGVILSVISIFLLKKELMDGEEYIVFAMGISGGVLIAFGCFAGLIALTKFIWESV